MTTCEKKYRKIERNIFDILRIIASRVAAGSAQKMGAIVVFGDFKSCHTKGLVQMKPKQNPITSPIMIDTSEGAEAIEIFSRHPYDGAIVVNGDGEIIAAGIYLIVEHPNIDIPDGCGTRHKSAASFSLHNYVNSVLTLSEESNIVRLWRDGTEEKVLDAKGEKDEQDNI